jgi:tRNA-splicing ligase RtcB
MIIEGEHTTAEVKLPEEHIEDSLIEEMQEMVDHEAFQNPVKFMPDTHGGLGPHAIVGFSMPLNERVIPNTVGGDIGCGMTAVKLEGVEADFDNIDTLRAVNEEVRERVPMGTGRVNDRSDETMEWLYPWPHANVSLRMMFKTLDEEIIGQRSYRDYGFDMEYFEDLCERVGISEKYAKDSLGSLGSGNHFIEIAESENDGSLWVVVHSGSRNLGQKVKSYHQDDATFQRSRVRRWEMPDDLKNYVMSDGSPHWEKIKQDYDGEKIAEMGEKIESYSGDSGRNTKLDYLEGSEMFDYLRDMIFTQHYASHNRKMMVEEVAETLNAQMTEYINSPHNYIDFDSGMIRKGSTRAITGERFVIPMNMEDGTLVCRGKGNPEWNQSAPHGAGRLGSRGWAHEQFDADEARKRMYENGTYSANVPGDEVPEAYKETKLIEREIEPTAEVIDRLVPKMNFKA